jgi:hypothetical protein
MLEDKEVCEGDKEEPTESNILRDVRIQTSGNRKKLYIVKTSTHSNTHRTSCKSKSV